MGPRHQRCPGAMTNGASAYFTQSGSSHSLPAHQGPWGCDSNRESRAMDRVAPGGAIGATDDGKKELIAVEDGYRESEASWLEMMRGLEARSLTIEPELATGGSSWHKLAFQKPRAPSPVRVQEAQVPFVRTEPAHIGELLQLAGDRGRCFASGTLAQPFECRLSSHTRSLKKRVEPPEARMWSLLERNRDSEAHRVAERFPDGSLAGGVWR